MNNFIINLPPIQCYIRKEYLYDFQKGFGELTPCVWVSAKSIKGKALYIESLLTDHGALYDKLPISAYVWKPLKFENKDYPLDFLQIWDCLSYDITILQKDTLKGLRCGVYMKNKETVMGEYMFTIDSCSSNPNLINTTLSETPNEHKSYNVIKLDNGQFAAQPNNRMKWFDQSLISHETKFPDFKVSTHEFTCEKGEKWSSGDETNYFYEIKEK